LTTDLASMNWSFSNHVVHFLVSVRLIFYTRSHANNNSPRRIRGKDQYRIINSTKLRVDCSFHFVPLMHFKWVSSNISTEVSSRVTMKSTSISRKLWFKVNTITFPEWFDMSLWNSKSILNLLHNRHEVSVSLSCKHCSFRGSEDISAMKPS